MRCKPEQDGLPFPAWSLALQYLQYQMQETFIPQCFLSLKFLAIIPKCSLRSSLCHLTSAAFRFRFSRILVPSILFNLLHLHSKKISPSSLHSKPLYRFPLPDTTLSYFLMIRKQFENKFIHHKLFKFFPKNLITIQYQYQNYLFQYLPEFEYEIEPESKHGLYHVDPLLRISKYGNCLSMNPRRMRFSR